MIGQLVTYHEGLTIFESGDLSHTASVLFIAGLGNGYHSVPYLPAFSERLEQQGWSLVQIQLSSSNNQFGFSSLESDAEEIEYAVDYLRRERGKTKIVLMGHSTGCQDAMEYCTKIYSTRQSVNGAILQAPVSDREFFDRINPEDHPARKWRQVATEMVQKKQGQEWLPREASASLDMSVPITAYRLHSLYSKGGDDDYFSSDLANEVLSFSKSSAPLLLILGEIDEFYPTHLTNNIVAQTQLLDRWKSTSEGKISALSTVVRGGNHSMRDEQAAEKMMEVVAKFLQEL